MAYRHHSSKFASRCPLLKQGLALMIALSAILALAGCPEPEKPLVERLIDTGGTWSITPSPDEGSVHPKLGHWYFQQDGIMQLRDSPGLNLTSVMPYQIVDDAIMLDGPVKLDWKGGVTLSPPFDSLEVGDVFAHFSVAKPLRPRDLGHARYTFEGSYFLAFTEECGGETSSGTLRGTYVLISKQGTELESLP